MRGVVLQLPRRAIQQRRLVLQQQQLKKMKKLQQQQLKKMKKTRVYVART